MNTIKTDTLIALSFAVPVFIYKFISAPALHITTDGIFILLLFSPVVEEFFFRGILMGVLLNALESKTNKYAIIANLATSFLFMAVHFAVRQTPDAVLIFFPSLVLGWHYGKHRNIPLVILIHAFYNTTAFIQ